MKNIYIIIAVLSVLSLNVNAQDKSTTFEQKYQTIDQEFKNWDPVRGGWLSSSIVAVANNERIPDRTFPENFTPYQMLSQVPNDVRLKVATMARTNAGSDEDAELWNAVDDFVAIRDCSPVSGRSYGDPHLVSFDGARYSFQTVGEFVYARANNGKVEVQTRQKPQGDDFSLNTAMAANVNGDRVCIYASDYPDTDYSTPVRVNGQSVHVGSDAYFLNNGGTVRFSNNMYVVDWPTGETVSVRMQSSGGMRFMNVNMKVFPCSGGGYSGLMGNANNIASDDFNNRSSVAPARIFSGQANDAEVERQRQQWLSKEFAESYRITQAESLFDYAPGQSTFTFTDRSFPRYFRTIHDLNDQQRNAARQRCAGAGIDERDMQGCIYDNGYLNIEPSRPHVVDDPTEGTVLRPVDDERPNVNPKPLVDKDKEIGKPSVGAQPIDQIIRENKESEINEPKVREISDPVGEREISDPVKEERTVEPNTNPWGRDRNVSQPERKSNPVTFPKTEPKPAPRPAPRPAPAPKPTVPKSGGNIKPGRG